MAQATRRDANFKSGHFSALEKEISHNKEISTFLRQNVQLNIL